MQERLVEFCQKWNIIVTAYSSLARGGAEVTLILGNKIDIFNEPILVELGKKIPQDCIINSIELFALEENCCHSKIWKTWKNQGKLPLLGFRIIQRRLRKIETIGQRIENCWSFFCPYMAQSSTFFMKNTFNPKTNKQNLAFKFAF